MFLARRKPANEFANPDGLGGTQPVTHEREYVNPDTPNPDAAKLYARVPQSNFDRYRQVEHSFDFFKQWWQDNTLGKQAPFYFPRFPTNAGKAGREPRMKQTFAIGRKRSLARRIPMQIPDER